MGLLPLLAPQGRQTSSVKALLRVGLAARAAAAAAGSARMLRVSATKQARGRRPHLGVTVLYVDRGVIVVNKPPGLVSQGNTAMMATATATRRTAAAVVAPAPPSQALAFNDVLDGKSRTFCSFSFPYCTVLVQYRGTAKISSGRFFFSFFFYQGLRRKFDLGEIPYPVHRLDKVCTIRA